MRFPLWCRCQIAWLTPTYSAVVYTWLPLLKRVLLGAIAGHSYCRSTAALQIFYAWSTAHPCAGC